jgi:hypothetical protein
MRPKNTLKLNPRKFTTHPIRHPLHPDALPERAEVIDWYVVKAAYVGQILEFADGHTASLTYAEIRKLQEAAAETAVEEAG